MTWPAGAWPVARAAGTADVVLLGDSITSGQRSTSYAVRSYAQILRASLRATYGDGGSGFSPHWSNARGGAVVTGTTTTSVPQTVPNGHVVSFTSGRYTQTAEGTEVAVWFPRNPTGLGVARWRVDGGPWQTVDLTGVAGSIRAAASGLTAGAHVIDVEPVSGTVQIAGTEGRNGTGVRLHLMGLGGRTSGGNAFTGVTSEANATFRTATVGRWAPHLLIIALGVNDSNVGTVSTATYKANIKAHIAAARAARADVDVLLVLQHLGKFADNDYDGKKAALLDTDRCVIADLDLWARTLPDGTTTARTNTPPDGTSWGRWSQWGWFAGGTDSVHPGDTGHRALGALLSRIVTA